MPYDPLDPDPVSMKTHTILVVKKDWLHFFLLKKKSCYKMDDTSLISHLLVVKITIILDSFLSPHAVDLSAL